LQPKIGFFDLSECEWARTHNKWLKEIKVVNFVSQPRDYWSSVKLLDSLGKELLEAKY
jgi:hypothetical protein